MDTNIKRASSSAPFKPPSAWINSSNHSFYKNFPPPAAACPTGSAGATDGVPAHIVQPLPKELDPRLEPPLTPPGIVRPLTAEGNRPEGTATLVPTAGLKEDGEKAIEAYNVKEKTVRRADSGIPPAAPGHRQCPAAPAADTAPAAPNPEENFMRANSSNNLYSVDCDGDLYFDMGERRAVFMKNVRVRNPNLSMDCADHLAIMRSPCPEAGRQEALRTQAGKREGKERGEAPGGPPQRGHPL